MVCGDDHNIYLAKARGASVPEFQPWILLGLVKYQNLAMSFPVCARHKRISIVFGIAQVTALGLAVGGLMSMAASTPGSGAAWVSLALMLTGCMALYLAIVRFPVRIGRKGDKTYVVTILNQRYAHEFERANQDALAFYADLVTRGMR